MSPSRSKLAADAWGAVLRTQAALVPVLDRDLRSQTGLPLSWYDVLLELAAAEGGRLTMTEIGSRVVLSRSRASRVIDELADAGLVRRDPNPADARSAFAVLTAQGRRRYARAAAVYIGGIERHFAPALSTGELQIIRDLLDRVLRRLVSDLDD